LTGLGEVVVNGARRDPAFVDSNGVPYFKDPSGRYALRGVLGGWWTDFVTDDQRSAVGVDPEGSSLLADVPAPIWAAGTQAAPVPPPPPQYTSVRSGSSSRQTGAWSLIVIGVLALIPAGVWWAWLNGRADSTAPALIAFGVAGAFILIGIAILVASLPNRN
jgi:hypothetical protein